MGGGEEGEERIGWNPATIRAKILRREITYVKLGRSVRIPESAIMRLIEENTIPARAEVRR